MSLGETSLDHKLRLFTVAGLLVATGHPGAWGLAFSYPRGQELS